MMKKITTAIIGGGASGLFCAALLNTKNSSVLILERGERLGKKLSSTGNGQGNVTNVHFGAEHYFTFEDSQIEKIEKILTQANEKDMLRFLELLGGLFGADERGRVYPTGRQASAVTDLLRFYLDEKGVEISLSTRVNAIQKSGREYVLFAETPNGQEKIYCENVVVCAGGKAAKNFGTDGSAYSLVEKFGHTVTKLYPSLVQLKTETKDTKTLKGIRVMNANVSAFLEEKMIANARGDVIFTEYGVSGDAIFKISSFITQVAESGLVTLSIDLLPDVAEETLQTVIKRKALTKRSVYSELLCGILNNQIGRVVMKRTTEIVEVAKTIKNFTLKITGSLGFDYAQVTKGGIPLKEVSDNLESSFEKGLYFAGEILDVDGECGGYNLQWAYSSARAVAAAINEKYTKERGQV